MLKTVARDARRGHARIEWISPRAAPEESAAGKAMLLDIREPVEREHHIAGAVQAPRRVLEWQFETSPEDKETA
jgi:rhodanese-related sulfurtransferase